MEGIKMAEEKTSTGIRISIEAMERLKQMAQDDTRNPTTQEIEWLIDQEWNRRNPDPQSEPPFIARRTVK